MEIVRQIGEMLKLLKPPFESNESDGENRLNLLVDINGVKIQAFKRLSPSTLVSEVKRQVVQSSLKPESKDWKLTLLSDGTLMEDDKPLSHYPLLNYEPLAFTPMDVIEDPPPQVLANQHVRQIFHVVKDDSPYKGVEVEVEMEMRPTANPTSLQARFVSPFFHPMLDDQTRLVNINFPRTIAPEEPVLCEVIQEPSQDDCRPYSKLAFAKLVLRRSFFRNSSGIFSYLWAVELPGHSQAKELEDLSPSVYWYTAFQKAVQENGAPQKTTREILSILLDLNLQTLSVLSKTVKELKSDYFLIKQRNLQNNAAVPSDPAILQPKQRVYQPSVMKYQFEDFVSKIPHELTLLIFGWLPYNDFVNCTQVCKEWRTIATSGNPPSKLLEEFNRFVVELKEHRQQRIVDLEDCFKPLNQSYAAVKQCDNICIFIRSPVGYTSTYYVKPSDTIAELKERIQDRDGVPVLYVNLICGGQVLRNWKTLEDHNVRNESTVHMIFRKLS